VYDTLLLREAMDFDSPDVEKDFPGLYASTEIGHKASDGNGDY